MKLYYVSGRVELQNAINNYKLFDACSGKNRDQSNWECVTQHESQCEVCAHKTPSREYNFFEVVILTVTAVILIKVSCGLENVQYSRTFLSFIIIMLFSNVCLQCIRQLY